VGLAARVGFRVGFMVGFRVGFKVSFVVEEEPGFVVEEGLDLDFLK
jgi:hypothetical protein